MSSFWILLVALVFTANAGLVAAEVEISGNQCTNSTVACKPIIGQICSGHGECRCGHCECKIIEDVRYSGKYCEKCPSCPGTCSLLKDCVECRMYKKGSLKDPQDCEMNCATIVPTVVDAVKYDDHANELLCTFYDEDECRYQFVYSETVADGAVQLHLRAQQQPKCPRVGRNLHSMNS